MHGTDSSDRGCILQRMFEAFQPRTPGTQPAEREPLGDVDSLCYIVTWWSRRVDKQVAKDLQRICFELHLARLMHAVRACLNQLTPNFQPSCRKS